MIKRFCIIVSMAVVLFCAVLPSHAAVRWINVDVANIRSGPGTNHSVLTKAERGQSVNVIEDGESWTKVRLSNGAVGWISKILLSDVNPYGRSTLSSGKWYEGGTLHGAGALVWQKSTYANKLATCADIVSYAFQEGFLKPSLRSKIRSVEDYSPYAIELVTFLNETFRKDPNPVTNRQMYANQTVSGTAVLGMIMMGWTEE